MFLLFYPVNGMLLIFFTEVRFSEAYYRVTNKRQSQDFSYVSPTPIAG